MISKKLGVSDFMKRKITYNSPVVLTYAFISLFVLILIYINNDLKALVFSVYRSSPKDVFFFIRLIGHVFGHANFQHYITNIMMILLLGPVLEDRYGSLKLTIMIVITAVITGIAHILLSPNTMLLGASGIVFMMVVLSSYVNIRNNEIPLTFLLVFVLYIGKEILNGIMVADHVSQLAHISGGIAGSVFGFLFNNNDKTNYY